MAKRKWLTEATFAGLVALCQFIPGPASSQTGMAIGLLRGGPLGMLAAWVGFTPIWTGAVHGSADFGLGLVAFLLLTLWAVPPWLVVVLGAVAGEALVRFGLPL